MFEPWLGLTAVESSSPELLESKLVRLIPSWVMGEQERLEVVVWWRVMSVWSVGALAVVTTVFSLSRSPGEEMGLSSREEPQKNRSAMGGSWRWVDTGGGRGYCG